MNSFFNERSALLLDLILFINFDKLVIIHLNSNIFVK